MAASAWDSPLSNNLWVFTEEPFAPKAHGEGKGASFIITLPLAPIRDRKDLGHALAQLSASDSEHIMLSGIKVLVIDDEQDARGLIKEVLTQCEAIVTTAANAEEALDILMKLEAGCDD